MDVKNNEARRLIFIIMKPILTPEEKKYLNRTCNYLSSLGMKSGTISIQLDTYTTELNDSEIDWNQLRNFSDNYRAEIPEGLKPILKKILAYIISEGKFESPDVDMINYQVIEIEIDCSKKDISITHMYSYYDTGSMENILYDSDEDKQRFDRWMEEDLRDVEVPSDGILMVAYNGGGDSGYIESSFEPTGDTIPASIEDWMYSQLESNFGGWEINEGSDGKFIFNFNNSSVELEHIFNNEESESNTLFEENFSL